MAGTDYPFWQRGFPPHFGFVPGFSHGLKGVIPGLFTNYPQDCGGGPKAKVGFGVGGW